VFLVEFLWLHGTNHFDEIEKQHNRKQSILVFLPGLQEINTMEE